MSFIAILFQKKKKRLQSFYVGKKAGELGKKCKALCIQLVFHDMGGLLFESKQSVHLLRKTSSLGSC